MSRFINSNCRTWTQVSKGFRCQCSGVRNILAATACDELISAGAQVKAIELWDARFFGSSVFYFLTPDTRNLTPI
jgi:hypothetical protein